VPVKREDRPAIFYKTNGVCHVCGRKLTFDDYGGGWVVDHVEPHHRRGISSWPNYLPACVVCNGLRWSYRPETIQRILRLGVIANLAGFHSKNSKVGEKIREMYRERLVKNRLRTLNLTGDKRKREKALLKARLADLDKRVIKRRQGSDKWWDAALDQVLAKDTDLKAAYDEVMRHV